MNLSDAQSFVIPKGTHSGRTLQAVAAGHLDDVRELLDGEESDTPFYEALQTFIAWADDRTSDAADVPPEPEDLAEGELDENGDIADPEAYEDVGDGTTPDEDKYEGPLGE